MEKILSKSPYIYIIVFLTVTLLMTIYEAIKEYLFHGSLTPWQSHTITIIITSLLATFASIFIRSWSEDILKKEQKNKLEEEKLATLQLLLKAVNHIVNNFLNHFQLLQFEVKQKGTIKRETLELLDESIKETTKQLKILEEIKNPEKKESYQKFYPK